MKTTKKAVSYAIMNEFGLDAELYKMGGVYYWVSDSESENYMMSGWDETCTHCVRLDETVEWFVSDFRGRLDDWMDKAKHSVGIDYEIYEKIRCKMPDSK